MFKGEIDPIKLIASLILIMAILAITLYFIVVKTAEPVSAEQTKMGYMASCCANYIQNKCCIADSASCRTLSCKVDDGTMTITDLAAELGTTPFERCC